MKIVTTRPVTPLLFTRALAPTLALTLALGLSVSACKEDPPKPVERVGDEDDGGNNFCPPPCVQDGVPAPWENLSFIIDEIDVGSPTLPAGVQGRLLRGDDGTIYYIYLKLLESEAECDIAVFAGGTAPNPTYQLRVAIKASDSDTWDSEIVPLDQVGPPDHITARYGVDATFNSAGRLVIAVAAGGPGLAQCGSTDAVVITRNGANNYAFQVPSTASGDCCQERPTTPECDEQCLDWCLDPACTSGTDVGAWSAIAVSDSGTIGVAFSDYHNFWDQDGQNHQGLEFWDGGTITGIRPWSGQGLYAALIYAGEIPIVAYTGYKSGGLSILRRATNDGNGNDWLPVLATNTETPFSNYWTGYKIGERIRLAKAPDGTIGLVFHARANRNDEPVNDLLYCTSEDGGETFRFPCKRIGIDLHEGYFPSLAYDADSVPYVAYRTCGPTAECKIQNDGVKLAWYDEGVGRWWTFSVHGTADTISGQYTQMVIDPDTKEATIVFQNLTRGTAVVVQGVFE